MSTPGLSLSEGELGAAEERLAERIAMGVERAARLGRPVLASVTVPIDAGLDVAACVFGSRGAEERYFVWEQPDRDGFALGALGSEWVIDAVSGGDRFREAARRCAEVVRDALADGPGSDPGAPPGSGPAWVGGFSFAPDGGAATEWASLPSTLLVLPSVSLVRAGGVARATVNVVCRAGDDPGALGRAAVARLHGLRGGPMPLSDPDQVGGLGIESELPPEDYVEAVAEATRAIRDGEIDKVVLARKVRVEARTPFHPATVFDGLRAAYPSCFCFAVGGPGAAFVGASPELLVRRQGARASTVALAGSARRSADPAVDIHIGERLLQSAKDRAEHDIVIRTIEKSLKPLSVWVTAGEEPVLVKVANIQHLATPIRAQLAEPRSVIELAGVLHPTSAVGGEPWERAEPLMRRLERLDRGWYAGPVGWMDATEDGELCVALRCALLEGRTAHCYAGVGVVAGSDPEAELAETEVKLQAILPVLGGA